MSDDRASEPDDPDVITSDMFAPAAPAPPPRRVVPVAVDDPLEPNGPRDFERGMSYLPPLTIALILANVLAFAWQLWAGALDSEAAIVAAGALHRGRVLGGGEVWRLLSAPFLHGSIDHLLGNCVILYIVGMACEHAVGTLRMALVYLASALAGSLLSMAMSPGPSVGASGAIFGIAGAVVVFLHRHQRLFYVRDKQIGIVLAAWAAYTLAIGFLNPFIDNGAHLGGLIAGAAVVLALRPRVPANATSSGGDPFQPAS